MGKFTVYDPDLHRDWQHIFYDCLLGYIDPRIVNAWVGQCAFHLQSQHKAGKIEKTPDFRAILAFNYCLSVGQKRALPLCTSPLTMGACRRISYLIRAKYRGLEWEWVPWDVFSDIDSRIVGVYWEQLHKTGIIERKQIRCGKEKLHYKIRDHWHRFLPPIFKFVAYEEIHNEVEEAGTEEKEMWLMEDGRIIPVDRIVDFSDQPEDFVRSHLPATWRELGVARRFICFSNETCILETYDSRKNLGYDRSHYGKWRTGVSSH